MNNLADLNFFVKSVERELSEKFKHMKDFNSVPTTPTQLVKKLEDQMKACGYKNKKMKENEMNRMLRSLESQQEKSKKGDRPQGVKKLALHQIANSSLD